MKPESYKRKNIHGTFTRPLRDLHGTFTGSYSISTPPFSPVISLRIAAPSQRIFATTGGKKLIYPLSYSSKK
jgi:hypothetical protein